jgi:hypothetical protein
MAATEPDDVVEVLTRVSAWPTEKRLSLAQMLLQTLRRDFTATPRQKSLRDLLGLLKTEGLPPSDAACADILEEERLRRYGA